MLREMQKRMTEFHMIVPGDRILVGVSGGADSVCLLVALYELRQEMDFSLEVVHVEHGIRGEESRQDEAFVKRLCEELGVAYQAFSVDVPAYAAKHKLGYEEAARCLRYEVFERLSIEKKAKIALAHHQEDNAETILFQMVRGSSLTGLCGIQPIREDEAGVCYIRPLLHWHRADIEDYLQSHAMVWRVDSTNVELEYTRNYLRAKVLPELTQINAQAVTHMNQMAAHLTEIKDYLDMETERLWALYSDRSGNKLTLDAKVLALLHPVMQRQLVYKAITSVAGRKKDITSTHVDEVLSLCKGQSGKQISLPYQIVAWKEFDSLCLRVKCDTVHEVAVSELVYEVSEEFIEGLKDGSVGGRFEVEGARFKCRILKNVEETSEIPRKTYTKWFDYDKIKQGFCIRSRRSGDYFICDALGHRKKLKEYFTDEKIPVEERDKRWLLARDSEVLWFIGGRMSEHIKVSPKTRYIFEITYDGGHVNE